MENTPAKRLFDLLVTRDFEPEILDAAGKALTDPSNAELFSFDWKTDGRNYGTVVILLGRENEMEIYYGDNLGRGMDAEDKRAWYDFLAQMKNFAVRNLMRFELNDISRLKYTMQGMAAIREGLFEGYYGRKNISYSDQPKQTRLMIKHSRNLGESEARYRAIESIFVETAEGERFRVPSRSLTHGKILARHVAEGGTPYDTFGSHINDIMNELSILSRFIRASRTRPFGGTAASMIDEAARHYHDLKAKARRMISQRGYREEHEKFDPAATSGDDQLVDSIRDIFLEQNIDQRIEEALPILAKIGHNVMKEVNEFESWVSQVTEGTWSLPDTAESQQALVDLMREPLPVGADATNASALLYDIIGDDDLFDRLSELADSDPEADARPIIQDRLAELGFDLESAAASDAADADMQEDLDVDGVMMTRPSNMSSESCVIDLARLRRLALNSD